MRAPFQILALPYKIVDGTPHYCVLHRADHDQWQFVSGGGEDAETPLDAAKREIFEEIGIRTEQLFALKNTAFVPNICLAKAHRKYWDKDAYIIPEYSFAFECPAEITLSHEHSDYAWMTYEQARDVLHWDSNKTAVYELDCRLRDVDARE
ncbi:MAG: NUDIX pyrophosphatase [Ruminococcaceae bacterium]|nr:NUDIX pyrophosphatase [Oscillospiraceae bacterium]